MKNFNLEERVSKARQFFKEGGYNCCQAVVMAYADLFDIDMKTAASISSGFGGGMGRMREVCGAVSGMLFVYSNLKGYSDPKATKEKMETYAAVQELMGKFKNKNGSYICRELIGEQEASRNPMPAERTSEYYKKRPCVMLVGDAAEILEECLKAEQ